MLQLSIITVCFNEVQTIERTLQSVVSQTFRNFEWLIIDGGSTDGTIEILNRYKTHFAQFISEKDNGIYNAMNKGIKLTKGEYLYFLNGGDYFFNNKVLSDIFSQSIEKELVYGNIAVLKNDEPISIFKMPENLTREFIFRKTIPHQSTLTKRTLFGKVGFYDEKYNIAADYEFSLRAMYLHNCSVQYIPVTFAVFRADGTSSNDNERETEKLLIHKTVFTDFQRFMLKYRLYEKIVHYNPINIIRRIYHRIF